MTSRNFKQSMVNQDQEIIFEVVKVSGEWVFPAASSIVEATRGKNMYLRLTDSGKSDIFRLDSVKDGENAGETVFGFVGNGGMDLVELTATTDGDGVTTGSWEYAPGEGPAGEAIGNLGKPLQWKGPATVAELNAGPEGVQPGWTYTLTDAGTLTDGSVKVDVGDEVAWTEDDEWFKVGGENSNVALFQFTGTDYPDGDDVLAEQNKGKTVVLVKYTSGYGGITYDYYYLNFRVAGIIGGVSATQLEFYPLDNSKKYVKAYKDLDAAEPTWVWSLEDTNVTKTIGSIKNGGVLTDAASVNVPNNALSTLATAQAALTLNVDVGANEVPNFAVEVTPSVDVTLTVIKTVNSTATELSPSVSGGNSLTSGKKYQVTCVGSCWTLAEFTVPTP